MAVSIALIAVAVTGCASHAATSAETPGHVDPPTMDKSPSQDGTRTGTARGRLLLVGGPTDRPRAATSGVVTLRGSMEARGAVDVHGRFKVDVDPGIYHVTGTTPEYGSGRYPCHADQPVVVTASETSHVDVYCQLR